MAINYVDMADNMQTRLHQIVKLLDNEYAALYELNKEAPDEIAVNLRAALSTLLDSTVNIQETRKELNEIVWGTHG